jgi:hypothetical protein
MEILLFKYIELCIYKMEIGNKKFKSKKELEKYTRDTIASIGLCSSVKIKYLDEYNFFIDLFRRHPKYPEKIYGICDIKIVKNKVNSKYLELNIVKDDNSEDDISWRNCVSGNEKDKFKSALRVSINDQIKQFRSECDNICSICKTLDADEYHVDHIIHFEEILYHFLQFTKKPKPTIFQNNIDNRKAFMSDDKEYEDEWKLFHKNKAQLRLLCRSCNLKRPRWKNIID